MPLTPPTPLPPSAHVPIVLDDPVRGSITPAAWQQWLASVDALLRLLVVSNVGGLTNAANDTAAAAAGVPLGGLYRNANAVQIRLV